MNGLLLLLAILALALLGSRLFVVVGVATALCFLLWVDGTGSTLDQLGRIVIKMESLSTKNVFLSIPFFIAAGSIMTKGGIAERLTELARELVGWLPGGLAVASIVACIVFAAISGSSPVTLVAVGAVMFPALLESGYPRNFAIGIITSAGSLGCMIPPAIAMLVYAISVQGTAAVDPANLFFAGLLPALFIAGLLALYAVIVGLKVPGSRKPFNPGGLWRALKGASWALTLPFLVLGGIYGGLFTPTEAGAVAFAAAVVISVFVHRDVALAKLPSILVEAATLIGSLILIVVLAFGLNDFLAEMEAPERIRAWVEAAHMPTWQFMLFTNLILIVLGALMDSISATLVFAPILAPVAISHYGIDPIHFGVVFVVNMEIGYLAPPVATNLFVAAALFRQPFGTVAKAIMPTLGIICGALLILIYVPTLSLGPLALRDGRPAYAPFPWDGKAVVEETPAAEPEAVPDRPLTLEEMMKKAKEGAAAEGAAAEGGAPPPSDRPLTLEEMMKKAKEGVAAEDAAAAAAPPANDAPASP
jgi:C4-dicarboxylate transporter DctM subunit